MSQTPILYRFISVRPLPPPILTGIHHTFTILQYSPIINLHHRPPTLFPSSILSTRKPAELFGVIRMDRGANYSLPKLIDFDICLLDVLDSWQKGQP